MQSWLLRPGLAPSLFFRRISSQDAYTAACPQLDPRLQPAKANAADQALEETVDRVAYILRCQVFRT